MARARDQSALEAIEKMTGRDFGMAAVDTGEGLTPEAQERIDQTNREFNKQYAVDELSAKLDAAVGHVQSLLDLIAGFNANHDPMQGWCRFCDGNYLHTNEACACVCHPAREFVKRMRDA